MSRLAYEHHHSYQIKGTNFQAAIKSKSYRYVYLHLMESFALQSVIETLLQPPIPLCPKMHALCSKQTLCTCKMKT